MTFLKKHYLAIIFSILVGLICVLPQLVFIFSLNTQYHGAHLMAIDDEEIYLSRMHDIVDGHVLLGSPWFFEYKNQIPIYPPTSDLIIVILSKIFFTSLINTLIILKFLLPLILFLLIYFLIIKIINEETFLAKISATAGATLITLGYGLIDYNQVLNYIAGKTSPITFLIWTRPSNPINGAIIIFSFFLIFISINKNYSNIKLFFASFLFALGIGSYFFTWGIILSVLAFIFIFNFLFKNFRNLKTIILIVLFGFIMALPYFYLNFLAAKSPDYNSAIQRTGMIFNHLPVFNKFTIFVIIIFFILSLIKFDLKKISFYKENYWWCLCAAFLLGSFFAYNQQVITGKAVFPPHFVQYTIPLSIITLVVIFYKTITKFKFNLIIIGSIIIITASIFYGSFVQVKAYQNNFDKFAKLQKFMILADWLDKNTKKDSVILPIENEEYYTRFIPALTNNNVYFGTYIFFLIPDDRLIHNYLTLLKTKDTKPEYLNEYIEKNYIEFTSYLGTMLDTQYNQESKDLLLKKTKIIQSYQNFYNSNLVDELKKYRINYVLSINPLSEKLKNELQNPQIIYQIDEFNLYQL